MHSRPRTVSGEQRDRLIRQLKDFLAGRPEILLALLHGSFPAGGPFRDIDLALYLDPEKFGKAAFRDYDVGARSPMERRAWFSD